MSRIDVNMDELDRISDLVGQLNRRLASPISGLSSMTHQVDSSIQARRNIGGRLGNADVQLKRVQYQLGMLGNVIGISSTAYRNTEKSLDKKADEIDQQQKHKGYAQAEKDAEKDAETWLDFLKGLKGIKNVFDTVAGVVTNGEIGLFFDEALSAASAAISAALKLPKFVVDGKYVKVLNADFYKGGLGLARRYTLENISNGKYAEASRLYNASNKMKIFSKAGEFLKWASVVGSVYIDLTTTEKISTEHKISNAVVDAAETWGAIEAGAAAGAAIGSVVPVAGTVVGAVAGAAIGYGIDKLVKWEVFDGKSALDYVKDGVYTVEEVVSDKVGDAVKEVAGGVKAAGKWIKHLF